MRVIGLDLGSKRIGVAVSDTSATIATPLTVIQRSKKHSIDHQAIASLVREEEAEAVVVGLPHVLPSPRARCWLPWSVCQYICMMSD